MARNRLAVPTFNLLRVQGQGMSPKPSPSGSPSSTRSNSPFRSYVLTPTNSFVSDAGSARSREYTVMDDVREMKHALEKQVETIRQQIASNEQNYNDEKAKLLEDNDYEIQQKDNEIVNLKESLISRDEYIQKLKRISAENDKAIKTKSLEFDDLRKMVEQTKENIRKIRRQMKRNQKVTEEGQPGYDAKNDEISLLTDEMEQLRIRLTSMGQEIANTVKLIQQNNDRIKIMDEENVILSAKQKEDLDKAASIARQNIGRTTEAIRQNVAEMNGFRKNNKMIQHQIHDITKLLQVGNISQRGHGQDAVGHMPPDLSNQPLHEQTTLPALDTSRSTVAQKLKPVKRVGTQLTSISLSTNPRRFIQPPTPPPSRQGSTDFPNRIVRGASFGVNSLPMLQYNEPIPKSARNRKNESVDTVARLDSTGYNHELALGHNVPQAHNKFNNKQKISPITSCSTGQISERRGGKTDVKRGPSFKK